MRLGTMIGGKAWAEIKGHAQRIERAVRAQRKSDVAKSKRRAELDDIGFRVGKKHPENWGAE
jgi:hypothetical protein